MERVFAELIRRASDEFSIVMISRDLGDDLKPFVEWRRIRVPARPAPLRFTTFYARAGLELRRTRADLVHTLGALVPNRADLASVHFCHAAFQASSFYRLEGRVPFSRRVNTRIARSLGLAAERWSYTGRIPILATVSEGVAREVCRHYPNATVRVTPNGVDLQRFRPDPDNRSAVRREQRTNEGDVVALFVGGDWDRKGLGIAIQALAHVRRRRLYLWVVGRGDEERFHQEAARLGVADRVRFLGPRLNTERYYQGADIFVLPSGYEAFPLVLLEAAASGLPPVVTAVNGTDEIIKNIPGLLVERTPEAIGEAVAQLASDPGRRAELGRLVQHRAAAYTWDRSATSVLEIYRELLEPRRVRQERAA
jgi:glycosyltransferase involved in cell wall biosynthesis